MQRHTYTIFFSLAFDSNLNFSRISQNIKRGMVVIHIYYRSVIRILAPYSLFPQRDIRTYTRGMKTGVNKKNIFIRDAYNRVRGVCCRNAVLPLCMQQYNHYIHVHQSVNTTSSKNNKYRLTYLSYRIFMYIQSRPLNIALLSIHTHTHMYS